MTDPTLPRPEAVIFDIGNVLITWQPEDRYDEMIGRARREAMFATVDLHAMNERFDRGEVFRDVVQETAETYPEFRDEILMWHDRWLDLARPPIDHSVRLLRALRAKGVPVFALTNFGIDSFALSEARDTFLTEFDRRYISGHMGVIKPEAEIYEQVEARLGLPGAALLFTDDRADNIAAAAARGWHTHHFTGPDGWAERLVAEGLLTQSEAQ